MHFILSPLFLSTSQAVFILARPIFPADVDAAISSTPRQTCDSKFNFHALMDHQHAIVCGPVQDDEALLLFGLLKTLRPQYVLEIGVHAGVSTKVIAEALAGHDGGTLYAVDLRIRNNVRRNLAPFGSGVKLLERNMLTLTAEHLDNKTFDFIFLDASHIYHHYVALFPFLQSILSPNGFIMTHDTGLHVNSSHLQEICGGFMTAKGCYCDGVGLCGFPHRKDNRRFSNWVLAGFPDWQVVHLHTFRRIRHGLTMMTRKRKLGMDRHQDIDCSHLSEC